MPKYFEDSNYIFATWKTFIRNMNILKHIRLKMTHDICDQYMVILKVLSMWSDDVVANRIKTNQYGCNGLGTCLHKSFSKLWLVLRWDFLV